jgi:hypothetical protein
MAAGNTAAIQQDRANPHSARRDVRDDERDINRDRRDLRADDRDRREGRHEVNQDKARVLRGGKTAAK